MKTVLESPDDRDSLLKLVGDLQLELKQLKTENVTLQNQNTLLQERIHLLLHKRFGANSEKYRAEQSDLFNEAEAYAEETSEAEVAVEVGTIEVDSAETTEAVDQAATTQITSNRKPGRKVLPHELPRV